MTKLFGQQNLSANFALTARLRLANDMANSGEGFVTND